MKDAVILRLLQDTCQKLEPVGFPVETPHVLPTYHALLAAVKANYPDEPYLNALTLSKDNGASPEELKILFGQLQILLEALIEEEGARGTQTSLSA
jgi:hypothetical protein